MSSQKSKFAAVREMWGWLEAHGPYEDGIDLLLKWHDLPLRKRYWEARRKQAGPYNQRLLEAEVQKLLNSKAYWRITLKVQEEGLPEPQPRQDTSHHAGPIVRVIDSAKIEALTVEIRKLATKRALLSNRLVDPGEDEAKIAANCLILDEIEPLKAAIRTLEQQRIDANAGEVPEEVASEDRVVISTIRGMSYTLRELKEMDASHLSEIRKKIRDSRRKYQKKIDRVGTKPATKAQAAEKVAQLKAEYIAVSNVINEKRAI